MKTCDHCGKECKRLVAVVLPDSSVSDVGFVCARRFKRARPSDLIRSYGSRNRASKITFYHGSFYSHEIGTKLKADRFLQLPEVSIAIRQMDRGSMVVFEAFNHPTDSELVRSRAMFFTDNLDCQHRHGYGTNYIYEVIPIGRYKRVDYNWYRVAQDLAAMAFQYDPVLPEDVPERLFPVRTLQEYVDGYYSGRPYYGPRLIHLSDDKCRWEYIANGIKIVRLYQ